MIKKIKSFSRYFLISVLALFITFASIPFKTEFVQNENINVCSDYEDFLPKQ